MLVVTLSCHPLAASHPLPLSPPCLPSSQLVHKQPITHLRVRGREAGMLHHDGSQELMVASRNAVAVLPCAALYVRSLCRTVMDCL